jgi:hypothetical protein
VPSAQDGGKHGAGGTARGREQDLPCRAVVQRIASGHRLKQYHGEPFLDRVAAEPTAALEDADPADKAEIYQRLGGWQRKPDRIRSCT